MERQIPAGTVPPKGTLIVMIQNENGTVIPDGNTVIHGEDTLVIARF